MSRSVHDTHAPYVRTHARTCTSGIRTCLKQEDNFHNALMHFKYSTPSPFLPPSPLPPSTAISVLFFLLSCVCSSSEQLTQGNSQKPPSDLSLCHSGTRRGLSRNSHTHLERRGGEIFKGNALGLVLEVA